MVDDKVGMFLLGVFTETASIRNDEERDAAERAERDGLVDWIRTPKRTWAELTDAGRDAFAQWLDPESRAVLGLSMVDVSAAAE